MDRPRPVLLLLLALALLVSGRGEPLARAAEPPADAIAGEVPSVTLAEILEGQAREKGGEAAARVEAVRLELDFRDDRFDVRIRLTTDRSGRGRSDVFDREGRHLITEGFDGERGWTKRPDSKDPSSMSPDGERAFRRNPIRTGHVLTLADSVERGAELTLLEGAEGGGEEHAVRLRLPDGHEVILSIDPATYRVVRRREKTALHPDLDSEQSWTEERLSDFRTVDGVSFPHVWEAFDVATGKRLSRVEVRSIELDPALPEDFFSRP